ncbi:hypothetical protein FJT64_002491 [Amphibalanus amphitrite]|uniref:Uncharacterized protein n=1 Tax=Amphibalanus amphitrite TaxID=1232801 RepID=A0A6A4WUW3_AMPAM|nr:hypothetical protein FJT64_002491 [Amphibalanus amphitrite]
MSRFAFPLLLLVLVSCWAEYLPPLKEVFENAEFREALISLGQCRSHLYVCAYRLAQCVERARGPNDPPSENVLMQTVQRWGDARDDELCRRALEECKEEYFKCDKAAPDPAAIVDAAVQKHARDPADLPLAKRQHLPLTDQNGDPVRDLLAHAEEEPAWDFDRQMPYQRAAVRPEKDPRLLKRQVTSRQWRWRPVAWASFLANALLVLVLGLAAVLLRRGARSLNVRLPRRIAKYARW